MQCLEICRALPIGDAVVAITEKACFRLGTNLGVIITTVPPIGFFAVAGGVAVAKQKAAGASEDRKGAGPNTVHC